MVISFLNLAELINLHFGSDYKLEPAKPNLPLVFDKNFTLFRLQAVGNTIDDVLVVPKTDAVPGENLLSISKMLIGQKETPLVLLYGRLCAHKEELKNNLFSFVCDDRQSYFSFQKEEPVLPGASVDRLARKYTKGTQLVLKYYLFTRPGFYSARDIAKKTSMSISNVSRANSFLFAKGFLNRRGVNSGSRFSLIEKRKQLKELEGVFVMPYRKKLLLAVDNDLANELTKSYLLCGDSALAKLSDLSSSSNQTDLALSSFEYESLKERLAKLKPPTDLSKMICLYEFIYGPSLFASDGCIDMLDLYLMERNTNVSNDPRLKSAIDSIWKRIMNNDK